MSEEKRPHHHGDLRRALVAAGIELLAEHGRAALTLRACAARVGVSHAAPAHHFTGLPGLLAAIAAEGFRRFTAALEEGRATAGPGPRDRLVGVMRGYIAFAAEAPALFNLMFGDGPCPADDPELAEASGAAYGILAAACAPLVPRGTDPLATELAVWSLVHGFAHLAQNDRLGPGAARARTLDPAALLAALAPVAGGATAFSPLEDSGRSARPEAK